MLSDNELEFSKQIVSLFENEFQLGRNNTSIKGALGVKYELISKTCKGSHIQFHGSSDDRDVYMGLNVCLNFESTSL